MVTVSTPPASGQTHLGTVEGMVCLTLGRQRQKVLGLTNLPVSLAN